jgi:hypothetical protein
MQLFCMLGVSRLNYTFDLNTENISIDPGPLMEDILDAITAMMSK